MPDWLRKLLGMLTVDVTKPTGSKLLDRIDPAGKSRRRRWWVKLRWRF